VATFAGTYGQNPWSDVDRKTIPYYVPALLEQFRLRNVYAPFTTFAVDMEQQNAETMYFSELFDIEADKSSGDNRELWFNTSYIDSRQFSITCERHFGKIALHKYEPWVTYWRKNGGDLRQIARGALGISISDVIDELTRDAYLAGPYWLISGHTSATKSASGYPNFSAITATDTFNPDDLAKIFLIMDMQWNVPFANDPTGVSGRSLFAVTTPGVWYDLITDDTLNFREKLETLQDPRILRYEVGQYLNTRYIKTGRNVLWNCGTITAQTTLSADAAIGSGAAATVDGHYTVGQTTVREHTNGAGNTRYVTVADATGLAVGDIVTLHKTRTSAYGVTNGVDFNEGTLTNRRIVSISGTNIAFDKPILRCEYDSGHYLTKAVHIHATVVIGGPRAVVWGVTQPPSLYTPPVIDDGMGQIRYTWDSYMKAQQFRPEMAYVIYSAGSSPEGMLPSET
jgi:hypothetical protein